MPNSRPRGEQRVPDRPDLLGRHVQLVAELAGVAAARAEQLDVADRARLEAEEAEAVEVDALDELAQQVARARALHGEQRDRRGDVGRVGAGADSACSTIQRTARLRGAELVTIMKCSSENL